MRCSASVSGLFASMRSFRELVYQERLSASGVEARSGVVTVTGASVDVKSEVEVEAPQLGRDPKCTKYLFAYGFMDTL